MLILLLGAALTSKNWREERREKRERVASALLLLVCLPGGAGLSLPLSGWSRWRLCSLLCLVLVLVFACMSCYNSLVASGFCLCLFLPLSVFFLVLSPLAFPALALLVRLRRRLCRRCCLSFLLGCEFQLFSLGGGGLLSFSCCCCSVCCSCGWSVFCWLVLPCSFLYGASVRFLVLCFRSLLCGCFSSCLWCLSLFLGGYLASFSGGSSPFFCVKRLIGTRAAEGRSLSRSR